MKIPLPAALLPLVLAACSAGTPAPVTPAAAHRIVTLMPSFAEDLCAIGAAKQLVGVSEFSSDVPCARTLPQVNNFSSVNTERIVALRSDRVIAIPAQRAMTAGLVRAGIPVTYISDDSYADIFSAIAVLGDLSGRRASAFALIDSLRARTAALQRKARYKRVPSVLFVEQALPLWTVGSGSYIASLITLAGGRLASADLKRPYAQYSYEALLRADPDVIVATGDARIEGVLSREPWRSLRAVREHHVFVAKDSNALSRPSPRYVDGLQWLISRFSSL